MDLGRKAVGNVHSAPFASRWGGSRWPFEPVEEFICYLYIAPDVKGGADIFRKGKKELDLSPPTFDALQLLICYLRKLTIQAISGVHLVGGYLWAKVCLKVVACGRLPDKM